MVARLGRADQLERGHVAGPDDVVHLVVALVEHAGGVEPPHDVHAPVHPGHPDVAADRQGDGPPGPVDLVGQLDTGRRRADHQHPALLELVGIAVVGRGDASDARGDGARRVPGRRAGCTARWRAPPFGPPLPVGGADRNPSSARPDRGDLGVRLHRRVDRVGVGGDVVDHLGHRHVAVGIVALVAVAGQAAQPVGREQAQRIPALRPPGVGDLAALEHDVIDRALGSGTGSWPVRSGRRRRRRQ